MYKSNSNTWSVHFFILPATTIIDNKRVVHGVSETWYKKSPPLLISWWLRSVRDHTTLVNITSKSRIIWIKPYGNPSGQRGILGTCPAKLLMILKNCYRQNRNSKLGSVKCVLKFNKPFLKLMYGTLSNVNSQAQIYQTA